MSPKSPLPERAPAALPRRRMVLVGALVLGAFALPMAAFSESLPGRVAERLGLKAPVRQVATSPPHLPGFRKQGTLLVGTMRAEDGSSLRMVFDARTMTLVGLKQVEPATTTTTGCVSLAPDAPLPSGRQTAN
ncbi:MAG TPA: hypothetical protein PKW21_08550 [Rhabdaerophilum sp.]|nr:hypothetical protein [Rhabdaerophilum sp.]